MVRAFLLAAAMLAGAPLFAQAQADAPLTALVSYADLNLAHPAGQKVFAARIRHAVEQVCPELNSIISSRVAANRCRREVAANAQRQMAMVVASAGDGGDGAGMTIVASR